MLAMATRDSIFHKTAAGHQACRLADSRLPQDYRMILATVQDMTSFRAMEACLPHCSPAQILRYLEDLEAIGLIESVSQEWFVALHRIGDYDPKPLS